MHPKKQDNANETIIKYSVKKEGGGEEEEEMANYKIRCEAIDVRTESGICPGSAKCRKGETYILTARTQEPAGMCGRAFAAVHPMTFAMRWSEKMEWEKTTHVDVTCPDGFVRYRLSRVME